MVKRPVRPEELKLWSMVAATVHPLPGRARPKSDTPAPEPDPNAPAARIPISEAAPRRAPKPPRPGPDDIEPRRKQRITREREEIGARIDLHGYDQDQARAALDGFLIRSQAAGYRAVLVITGKGSRGEGVLRRRVPEWLAAPHLREVVAGLSEAHRRHGGEGALYVALKRKPRS